MNNKITRILSLLLILCILIGKTVSSITYAEDKGIPYSSISSHPIINSRGLVVGLITMADGEITIKINAHKASTNVKWETIGLTVTTKKLDEMNYDYKADEATYHLTGVKNVNTVIDGPRKELMFSDAEKSPPDKDTDGDGIITTTFTFSVKKVQHALGEEFDNIAENTPIYLHGIFDVYKEDSKGHHEVYEDYKHVVNWIDILTAKSWDRRDNQLDDFAAYFNMEIDFKPPAPIKVEIHAATEENGKLVDLGTLKSGETGETYRGGQIYPRKEDSPFVIPDKFGNYIAKGYYFSRYTEYNEITKKDVDRQSDRIFGTTIEKYILPNAKEGSTVILYVAYEKPDIKMDVLAINKKTGAPLKTIISSKDVSNFKTIPQPVPPTIDAYKLTNDDFSYTYKKLNGMDSTQFGKTDTANNQIEFPMPDDINSQSTITVKVYYDNPAPGDIPVSVIAIDKTTNKQIINPNYDFGTGTAKSGEKYTHSKKIPTNLQDEATSKTYTYSGSWDWSFQYNTANASTKITKGSGSVISFTVPPASDVKDKITVKVYYNPASNPTGTITLRVTMEALSGGTIKELSKETVTRNQSITRTAEDSISVNGIVYQYKDKWEYEYITSSGSLIKNGTGNIASFKIPSDTNVGSIVELRLYYEAENRITPIPQEEPIEADLDSPTPYGIIDGDKYGSRYFTSEQGISTTESQYVYVKTKDYLLGYKLVNKTGYVDYSVPVTVSYTLKYYTATPKKPKPITEVVKDPRVVTVRKNYSYWEIAQLEYYTAGKADIYNYSLPGGSVTLNADSSLLDVPALSTQHSGSLQDHVFAPRQVTEGIEVVVSEPITSNTSNRPEIDYIDPTSYAIKETEEATVKNDYLSFDGYNILTNTTAAKEAPSPTNTSVLRHCSTITKDKALFTDGKVIKAEKENGIYSSNGNAIYYLHPESVNAYSSSLAFNVHVNSVTIHTPVICNPIISADNSKWSQVLDPVDDAVQIVLDPDTSLNDFSVTISNTLHHSNRLGYYTRDFSRSFIDPENVSYIAKQNGIVRNEMKLPFDVYVDKGNDKNSANDEYIKAGTWIIMGRVTVRFYVPLWIQEGTYTAEFRTIAVNGTDRLNLTETTGNYDLHRYVATSQKTFQISGRIYGLNLYDISDYPKWKEAFRVKDTMLFKYFEGKTDGTQLPNYNSDAAYYYTVGTKNQYGTSTGRYSQYTFPLVNGSHPRYKNLGVLKTGYAIRFLLNTSGEMYSSGCKVKITPTFYYVDANGRNRRQVDLYYNEEINGKDYPLVKMGQGVDLVNIKSGITDNIYSRIPEREIAQTAAVMNKKYSLIANQRSSMYSYTDIRLMPAFRTFVGTGYAKFITGLASYKDVKDTTGLTQTGLTKYLQRWYGTYKIPTNVHAVQKGTDVWGYLRKYGIDYDEDFWLKDGYIIVNFNIVTIDKNGKKHLSYINGNNYLNHGNCSMWVTEGAPLQKTDNRGVTFNFKAGDFIIYYTDKKYSDDYEGNLY